MTQGDWLATTQRGDARGFLRPSLGRALQDTIVFHWLRTAMAVVTAAIAALIAFIVTGNPASWLAVLAAPIALVVAFVALLALNLGGWNRRCQATWWPDPNGGRLYLRLQPKDRTAKHGGPVWDCWVRIPDKRTVKHRPGGRSFRGLYQATYPDEFKEAPPLAPGRHRVTWVEETSPGKWREILTHRLTVTEAGHSNRSPYGAPRGAPGATPG